MAGRRPQSREEEELLSLANETASVWKSLGKIFGLTDLTVIEIEKADCEAPDKIYAVLRKWKESLGSGASYQALARVLDRVLIKMPDLIEKHYDGIGRKVVFKTGQPGDEELLSLATEFQFDWISLGLMLQNTDQKLKNKNLIGPRFDCTLDNRFINMYHLVKRYCCDKGREEVLKKGQPGDEELLSLSQEFVINWRSLGMMSGLTDLTLNEIDEYYREESAKTYGVLKEWTESLGSGASYQALALLLDIAFPNRHDLVETYCHDKHKEQLFKTGKPRDDELCSLAHNIVSLWRTIRGVLCPTTRTLAAIDTFNSAELDKTYTWLKHQREELGSRASYRALALKLEERFIAMHHLVNRHSHGKVRETVFKIGQPRDEELLSLAYDIVLTWRSFDVIVNRTPRTAEIDKSSNAMLIDWKKALGYGAGYRVLARVLDTLFINRHDLVERYCHDKGREVFKKGRPSDEELLAISVSQEFVINWRSLGMMLGFGDRTLNAIDEANHEESDKVYAVLRQWRNSLGESYRALALLLDIACTNSHDLVEKYCHKKGEVFKIDQPSDEELKSLSQEFVNWRPLGIMLGFIDYTLELIDQTNREEEDKIYTMLTQWKEALGFRAGYGELARVLNNFFIDGHNLIERYCRDTGREEMFKMGQPTDEELFNLADSIESTWRSLAEVIDRRKLDSSRRGMSANAHAKLKEWKRSLGSRATYLALARMLDTTFVNMNYLVEKYCHNEDREMLFKRDQPTNKELRSLAHDILSTWRSLGVVIGLKALTLAEIDAAYPKVSDKIYAILTKWKESLGSGATYVALGEVLDNAFIKRHDLVERFCHDEAVVIRWNRQSGIWIKFDSHPPEAV